MGDVFQAHRLGRVFLSLSSILFISVTSAGKWREIVLITLLGVGCRTPGWPVYNLVWCLARSGGQGPLFAIAGYRWRYGEQARALGWY